MCVQPYVAAYFALNSSFVSIMFAIWFEALIVSIVSKLRTLVHKWKHESLSSVWFHCRGLVWKVNMFTDTFTGAYFRLRARNTFAPLGGIFETMFYWKPNVWRVFLVGWLQLASGAFVCYLAVKYVTLKIKTFFLNLQTLTFYLYMLNIWCSLVLLYRKLTNQEEKISFVKTYK